jgi:hypothetical protein
MGGYPTRGAVLCALLLSTSACAQQAVACAATLADLRTLLGDANFPLNWRETSMRDGRPLLVSVQEHDGALALEFTKTGEGLWARSSGTLCRTDQGLEIRISAQQVQVGPAAHWVLRLALGNGGTFTLTRPAPAQLHIATAGWSGLFAAQAF